MASSPPKTGHRLYRDVGLNVVICLAISLALTVSEITPDFLTSSIVALSIGASVQTLATVGSRFWEGRIASGYVAVVAVPLGTLLGGVISALIVGFPNRAMASDPGSLTFSLVVAAVVCAFFIAKGSAEGARTELREEILRREQSERQIAESELKLLQAQIEPHFLFNTLGNILSLMDSDSTNARRMLEKLTAFLRASLARTRRPTTHLAEEFEILSNYLDIQQMRFGRRLEFHLDAADDVTEAALPPLLVQPLVENAVVHGIAPQEAGGYVHVRAECADNRLTVTVTDNGVGFEQGSVRPGTGLTNVRARVRSLYGEDGALTLEPLDPHGLVAKLELPLS